MFAGYYVKLAKELEAAGCHILGIKDMAGLLKPAAARVLISTLKNETDLPLHLHTHDTSGISGATVLARGHHCVDAVDAAMDALSGATSQPCLGSLVEALRHTERDTGLDPAAIRRIRFLLGERAPLLRRLRERPASRCVRSLSARNAGWAIHQSQGAGTRAGLDARWHEVAETYRVVNDMFGDIVKVTPSSKVVGDMALDDGEPEPDPRRCRSARIARSHSGFGR
ncbi:MAG: hypothetical protein WDN29_15195 [Methylovirgula sp.]